MYRKRNIILGVIFIVLFVIYLIPFRPTVALFCPLFHTVYPLNPYGRVNEIPRWWQEKNYIDQYGNLWLFDREVNQIVVLHVGIDFLKSQDYIGNEKSKTIIVNKQVGNSSNEGMPESKEVYYIIGSYYVSDLKRHYSSVGHRVSVSSGLYVSTVFSDTDFETDIPLARNKLLVGTGDTFVTYDIPRDLAQKVLLADDIEITYESALNLTTANLKPADRENFLNNMKSWEYGHPVIIQGQNPVSRQGQVPDLPQ